MNKAEALAYRRKIETEVKAGERLWYDGKLYKVIQTHTASNLWTPDHNPALYTEVSIEEWPTGCPIMKSTGHLT